MRTPLKVADERGGRWSKLALALGLGLLFLALWARAPRATVCKELGVAPVTYRDGQATLEGAAAACRDNHTLRVEECGRVVTRTSGGPHAFTRHEYVRASGQLVAIEVEDRGRIVECYGAPRSLSRDCREIDCRALSTIAAPED